MGMNMTSETEIYMLYSLISALRSGNMPATWEQPESRHDHGFMLQPGGKINIVLNVILFAPSFEKWHLKNDKPL